MVIGEESLILFMLHNFLVKITITGVVHNDAQSFTLVDKRLFVTYDVFMLDRSQDSDFVKGIFLFFLAEIFERNLFKSVELAI